MPHIEISENQITVVDYDLIKHVFVESIKIDYIHECDICSLKPIGT